MKDINWEDPYKKKAVGIDHSRGENEFHHGSQDSFANRFLEKNRGGDQVSYRAAESNDRYSDQYLASPEKMKPAYGQAQDSHSHFQQPPVQPVYPQQAPVQPGYTQEPPPGYYQPPMPAYHVSPSNSGTPHAPWRFLDLKNKKQTGDLYKKILTYNKKTESNAFCFTSSTPREGVTTILTNLVDYIRNQGSTKQVLVIDANLTSPNLDSVFGLPSNCSGLKDVLNRRIDIQSALYPIGQSISVLCSGNQDKYSQGSLEPDDFLQLVNSCKQLADYILIDCPPVLSASDAFSVLPAADISFLVLQAVQVRRQVAEKALALLQNNECELGGAILNRVQQVIPSWVYRYI